MFFASLCKNFLETLQELLPVTRRNEAHFEQVFNDAGLKDVANYQVYISFQAY